MDHFTYSGSPTLKNNFLITDYEELAVVETVYVEARSIEIRDGYGPKSLLNVDYLKAIHKHLFQDVYEWAGSTRDTPVTLSDGTIATAPFLQRAGSKPFLSGPSIAKALTQFETKIREADFLCGLARKDFAIQAGDLMAELNDIHPFREGNGRTQRVFMEQLALSAGHQLDFSIISKERMIQASIEAREKADTSMMRRMFDEISDPARVSLMTQSIEALERRNYNWNEQYVAALAPGHSVKLILAGVAGDQFMGRTDNAILFGRTIDLPDPRPLVGDRCIIVASDYGLPVTRTAEVSADRKQTVEPLADNSIREQAVTEPQQSISRDRSRDWDITR